MAQTTIQRPRRARSLSLIHIVFFCLAVSQAASAAVVNNNGVSCVLRNIANAAHSLFVRKVSGAVLSPLCVNFSLVYPRYVKCSAALMKRCVKLIVLLDQVTPQHENVDRLLGYRGRIFHFVDDPANVNCFETTRQN